MRAALLLPLALLGLPLLSGCTDDAASHMIEGRNHSLSITREQPYFWESKVKYSIVVTRLPDCQRKHFIMDGNPLAKTELYDMGGGTYALRLSKKMFVTETRTCQGFAPLEAAPAEGLGTLLGKFQEKDGAYAFWPEPKPVEAPAPAAPPAAETTPKPAQ